MTFIKIVYEYSYMEAVFFPDLFRRVGRWLEEEMMIFIKGNIETRNNRIQWLLQELTSFNEDKLLSSKQRLFIQLIDMDHEQALEKIREVTHNHARKITIIIFHKETKKTYQLTSEYNIAAMKQIMGIC